MKVVFLKDHLDNKAGDEKDIADELANYLVRVNVAGSVDDSASEVDEPAVEETIELGEVAEPVAEVEAVAEPIETTEDVDTEESATEKVEDPLQTPEKQQVSPGKKRKRN